MEVVTIAEEEEKGHVKVNVTVDVELNENIMNLIKNKHRSKENKSK